MKRQIVKSKEEFVEWVNSFNGIMNCYTTVYDFEHFAETAKVEDSVIIDRAFLDFDAHGEPLLNAWVDFKDVYEKLFSAGMTFDSFFSGKGFHIIVYGEETNDIRNVQAYFSELAKSYPTLDRSGIQTNRLRRIPNTVNLSSEENYFCIPISDDDVSFYRLDYASQLSDILRLAKKPRRKPKAITKQLMEWPKLKPIEVSDVEIEAPKTNGGLPILPCLHNAIMVENPGHFARVYLVQWYRDILTMRQRNIPMEKKQEIVGIIMNELKRIASLDEIWLDWDEPVTRKNVWYIVNGGYHAPSCKDRLIPQGYCVGKCWRYCE